MNVGGIDHEGLFLAVPEADVVEQRAPVLDDSRAGMDRLRRPFEADTADVLDQQQIVVFDEEEYRG